MGYFSCLKHAIQIESGELLPLGQNQKSIGVAGGFVGIVHELGARVQDLARPLRRRRIVGRNLAAFLQQRLHQQNGGRFADIVGAALESQAQHAQTLAAQRPQRGAHFAQEALALVLVDAHDFIQQPELVSALPRHRAEGHQVLGKARSAVADAGIQKARTDAAVGADPLANLLHVRSHRFANRCHRIDKRNLHRQKGVGGVLDQFGALGAGDDQRRRNLRPVGRGNRILALVVAAVGHGRVNLAQHRGAAFAVRADHDAVGIKKVGDRGAFAQKFRVGGDIERIRSGGIAQNDLAHPVAGVNRDRTFLHHHFVAVDGPGNAAGHRFHVGEIGFALFGRRSADRDENGFAGAHRLVADRRKK